MATRRRRTTTATRRRRKVKNPSNTGDLVKYGLIAAAAYYVYTQWATWFPATTTTALPASPTTGTSGGGGTTPVVPTLPTGGGGTTATLIVPTSPGGVILPVPFQTTAGATIADASYAKGSQPRAMNLLGAAGGNALLDPDQWLFYYNQLSGDGVTYEQLSLPSDFVRSTTMDVGHFAAYLPTANALSGLGSFGFPSQYTQMANLWKTNWN